MSIIDRYIKLNEKERSLGENIKIISEDKIIHSIIKKVLKGNLDISEIVFIKDIPNNIIDDISNAFGDVYNPDDDGYVIIINDIISVYSLTDAGLFLGANAILRHCKNGSVNEGIIYNYPLLKQRGVKVYIPAREDIEYFKEFTDYCAYYGFNTMMIEIGGAMEYKRHPEINEGWINYCKKFNDYQGQSLDYQNAPKWARNSIHMENGGGNFLTQEEVKSLITYLRERHFEIIPEVPTLSHSDYILASHPELRERENDDLPDTYCPSNPKTYELVFDILDEIIEVFNPTQINIGHDEYFSIALCDRCKGKDPAKVFADDIIKIYEYLKSKNIKTIMWSEMLLNAIGKQGQTWGGSHKYVLNMRTNEFLEERPATYRAIDMLPKDIIMFHWYWGINKNYENEFAERGYEVVLGNFSGMRIENFADRKHKFEGVVISNWSALNKNHLQRNNILIDIGYTCYLLWGGDFKEDDYLENLLKVSTDIYQYQIRDKQNYIEVIHNTSVHKEHFPFVDGFMIDKEDDYLGKYIIELKSGNSFEVPLYYNLNIGTAKAKTGKKRSVETDAYSGDGQLTEATYTCEMVQAGEEIFYKLAVCIPELDEFKSIKIIEDSKYEKNIILNGINIQKK